MKSSGRAGAFRSLLAAAALAGVLAPCAPARAQDAEAAPVDTAELEALVETIEDGERRAALVARLRALIEVSRADEAGREEAPPSLGTRLLVALSEKVDETTRNLAAAAHAVFDIPAALGAIGAALLDPETRGRWLALAVKVALVLAAGALGESLVRRALGRTRRALEEAERTSWLARAPLLVARALTDLACIAAFGLAAYAALSLAEPRDATRLAAIALVNASMLARAVAALARLLLSPEAGGLRLWPMGDETANYWMVWVRRLTNTSVYGYFALETALLLGMEPSLYAVTLDLLGFAIASMAVVIIRQSRDAVRGFIRGAAGSTEPAGRLRRRLADVWHVAAVGYVAVVYVVWATEIPGGFTYLVRATLLTLVTLFVAALLLAVLGRLVVRAFTLSDAMRERYPGLDARANRYVPMLRVFLAVLVYILAALAILQAWDAGSFSLVTSDLGQWLLAKLLTIAAIVAGAIVVWEIASLVIESYIERAAEAGARSARLRTLLPLARKTLLVVLSVLVTLMVLSEVGIDIGPLLAGAGVVGLAIGFGAQTLVKDVITGIFILLEDSIKIGDVAEVGGHTGLVESLSIRTIRLRDLEGIVHVVPFSDVTTVLNYTKEFSFALLNVGVAYRENVDEVIEVLTALGEEMQADETHGPSILEPIQVLGLHSLDDSAVTIRARLKTVPGMQWGIRREFLRRMKARFDELGIEIPFPHRTLWFGVDKQGEAPSAPVRLANAEGGGPAVDPGGEAPAR